jgi:hypothetical protein
MWRNNCLEIFSDCPTLQYGKFEKYYQQKGRTIKVAGKTDRIW